MIDSASDSATAAAGWSSSQDPDPFQQQLRANLGVLQPLIPEHVQLIAVTKTFPAEAVRAAYRLGLRHFGENKIQEAITKQSQLADLEDITWHFIGHLQSNKARKALQHFDWIHSIDSLKLAIKLDKLMAEMDKPLAGCCLQVKMLPDPTKNGFELSELETVLPQLGQLQHLPIKGLMSIPPFNLSPEETKTVFEQTRTLAQKINQMQLPFLHIHHLSMGMSGDFSIAISAGATFIRLGTILFGHRG